MLKRTALTLLSLAICLSACSLTGCPRKPAPSGDAPVPQPAPEGPTSLGRLLFVVDEGAAAAMESEGPSDVNFHSIYLLDSLPPSGHEPALLWRERAVPWPNYAPETKWSADGRAALWAFSEDVRLGYDQLITLPGPGEEDVLVFEAMPHLGWEWHPSEPWLLFSDGSRITIQDTAAGRPHAEITGGGLVANRDGRFMPDGESIVCVEMRMDSDAPMSAICLRALAGTTKKTFLSPADREYCEYAPLPSPDGKLIAFSRPDGLWVMAVDGSARRQLTRVPTPDKAPGYLPGAGKRNPTDYPVAWSEDSSAITFEGEYWLPKGTGDRPADPVSGKVARGLESMRGDRPGILSEHRGKLDIESGEVTALPASGSAAGVLGDADAVTGGKNWRVEMKDGGLWFRDTRSGTKEETLIFSPTEGRIVGFGLHKLAE